MTSQLSPALRLNNLRKRAGLSLERFARKIGYARASSVQRYESEAYFEDEFLPLDFVRKAAEVLPGMGKPPITPNEVWSLAGVKADNDGTLRVKGMSENGRSYGKGKKADDLVPFYGPQVVHDGGILHFPQEADDMRERPVSLAGIQDAYLLSVSGTNMEPRYNEGAILHVNPHLTIKPGRGVVVHLTRGRLVICEYVQQKSGGVILRQYNPPQDWHLAKTDVKGLHAIVGLDEG